VVLSTLSLTSHPSHKKEHKESVRSKGPSDDKNNPPQIYWENLRFHSVDQTWQEEKCHQLELPFSRHFGGRQGGPHVILTRPHQKGINSVAQYISETKMDRKGTWGTDRELDVAAHLLQTPIMVYDQDVLMDWNRYDSTLLNLPISCALTDPAIYIRLSGRHFEVVLFTEPLETTAYV